ncbi:hypothetical protein Agub_g14423 [Astrephomene gubernaculifera]|uniref:Uncharacterized protein n=1 Tax=Astrephomene gubernaculifera TaxID=47775 RepID=A0AAD3E1L0_9CHLO|nr:hypothetical protein Agub_g14423 [Astrephomene gubernaculifera]
METFLWEPQSEGATRQRRELQQRAMLLGTLPDAALQSLAAGAAVVVGGVGGAGTAGGAAPGQMTAPAVSEVGLGSSASGSSSGRLAAGGVGGSLLAAGRGGGEGTGTGGAGMPAAGAGGMVAAASVQGAGGSRLMAEGACSSSAPRDRAVDQFMRGRMSCRDSGNRGY